MESPLEVQCISHPLVFEKTEQYRCDQPNADTEVSFIVRNETKRLLYWNFWNERVEGTKYPQSIIFVKPGRLLKLWPDEEMKVLLNFVLYTDHTPIHRTDGMVVTFTTGLYVVELYKQSDRKLYYTEELSWPITVSHNFGDCVNGNFFIDMQAVQ